VRGAGSCARTTLFFQCLRRAIDGKKKITADQRGLKANWLLFYPRASAKICGKVFFARPAYRRQLFVANYFLGAADGPSGWHVPVVPFMPKKQKHGLLQTSPLVHGLPHATTACVTVLNWWRDNAPAESVAVNIAANIRFLAISCSFG
jgi:hypothetical protein